MISQYLKNLIQMGIIRAIPLYGRKRKSFQYRHFSPVIDFAFYLNEKYGFFEAEFDRIRVGELLKEKMPKYMEWFFEELLARHFKLQPIKIAKPELEIDIALREYKKIELFGAEIKPKEKISGFSVFGEEFAVFANGQKVRGIGIYCNEERVKLIGGKFEEGDIVEVRISRS